MFSSSFWRAWVKTLVLLITSSMKNKETINSSLRILIPLRSSMPFVLLSRQITDIFKSIQWFNITAWTNSTLATHLVWNKFLTLIAPSTFFNWYSEVILPETIFSVKFLNKLKERIARSCRTNKVIVSLVSLKS